MRDAQKIVVLGGGVSGLSAAYELCVKRRRDGRRLEVVLLESSGRLGGKIVTETREGVVIEGGPDSFLTLKPQALELVKELGLTDELVRTNPSQSTIYMLSGGKLKALPDGTGLMPTKAWPLLFSELLSWKAKARFLLEPWVPCEDGDQDESIAEFVRRRFGAEALEKIAAPLLGGIFAGDAEKLSLPSTFPQLRELERRGGVLRGLAGRVPRAEGQSAFMTLRGGLSRLVEALAAALPAGTARTGVSVQSLRRRGGQWQLETTAGPMTADTVVSALPANVLAGLVADLDFELSCVLKEIPFVNSATVSMVYEREGFPDPLDGFGFLVPACEGKVTAGATYTSTKFPGRVPPSKVMIRSFIGGAGRESAAEADDAQIARVARHELKDILSLGERHPSMSRVFRWSKGNPQYTIGHGLRLRRIESCLRAHPGLVLAGASYKGVGIPDCIRSGRDAAARATRTGAAAPAAAEAD